MNLSELYNIFYAVVLYVVLVGMSEVTYHLFFARTNDSLAEEIVSGEFDCEK